MSSSSVIENSVEKPKALQSDNTESYANSYPEITNFTTFLKKLAKINTIKSSDLDNYKEKYLNLLEKKQRSNIPRAEIQNYLLFLNKFCEKNNNEISFSSLSSLYDSYIKRLIELQSSFNSSFTPLPRISTPLHLIKKNDNLLHEATNIVFKSNSDNEYVAVGVFDDGAIHPLTTKQVLICSSNYWKFDINCCQKSAATFIDSDCATRL